VGYSVRLVPDYGQRWPLWFDGDILDSFSDAPLSEHLKQQIVAWADTFIAGYHEETGWADPEVGAQFRKDGELLREEILHELGDGSTVSFDDWM